MIDEIIEIIKEAEIDVLCTQKDYKEINIWEDLHMDSIDLLTVLSDLGRHFEVELDTLELGSIKTIGDIAEYIAQKKSA
ncbi:acyl carrier protein [Cellulosilyticum ruminicola]|uniref:acyl carrier protein n=1 Tax=Cellulosilyticum ruminicola TaxID=425254 RepID=UPI0006CF5EBC|nr:acyl carrier protein [Cellulosilyticum ruminicola]